LATFGSLRPSDFGAGAGAGVEAALSVALSGRGFRSAAAVAGA
jgi:hypothetical protein